MASVKQVTGKKKSNDETQKNTQGSFSNQEKKDIAKKIKNLEDENKRLSLENVIHKEKFDLREILNVLSQKGVTELDGIEIAKDMVKKALEEADEKHSAEKKDMERKHQKEIETLSQKLQGADQQPTQRTNQTTISIAVNTANIHIQLSETTTEIEEANSAKEALEAKKQKLEPQRLQNEIKEQKQSYEKSEDLTENAKKALEAEKLKLEAEVQKLQKESKEHNHSYEKSKDLIENAKKALEAEKLKLEAEVQKLQKENKEQKNSYEKSIDLITNAKKALEAEKLKLEAEVQKLQNEKNQDTISKPVNPNDMHVLLRETTKEKDDAKSEKKALLEEKQKLEAEIQKLQKENKEEKISYERTKDLMEKEKGALLADKQKLDGEIKRLQDEIKALKQSEDKNKSLNEKLKKVEEAKDNLNQQVQALQKENNELKYRLKESQSPPLSNVLSANDNKTVQQLRVENERLLSRLSELAGAQMTHNNPNIADLSDGFRPTKLSEEYSQLYDNLWTDAFEEHSGKKEEDVIQMLRKGLLSSYKFCEKVCSEFTIQLTNSSLALPNSKPKKGDIPIVYKKQLQDMKKSFGVFLRNDVKESYWNQNTLEGGDKTKNYIDTCVELCWLMVIQDPPVVIETPASKDSTFDTNTYRAYTTTGTKVDFVVWPALRLHQGGPLLAKGVAQGKN